MAKIFNFDSTGKKPVTLAPEKTFVCCHREVIAYTVYRRVHCAICGIELDPFEVLVDMLKAHVPSAGRRHGKEEFDREVQKRWPDKSPEEKPSQE